MHPRAEHRREYWKDRDKLTYTCPGCGRGAEEVSEFHVHHEDGDATNGDADNLVALCRECHYDRHGGWTRRYTWRGAKERARKHRRLL